MTSENLIKYKLNVAEHIVNIDINPSIIDANPKIKDFPWFMKRNVHDISFINCSIQLIENIKQSITANECRLFACNKAIFGWFGERYITYLPQYPMFCVSDLSSRKIEIFLPPGGLNIRSFYLIFTKIREHAKTFLFNATSVPLHSAMLYHPVKKQSLLVTGESQCGKSTCCWYLIQNGYQLCNDDLISVAHNGTASGIGDFLHVTSDFMHRFFPNVSSIEVSPGRKHRLLVPATSQYGKQIDTIVIMQGLALDNKLKTIGTEEAIERISSIHHIWTLRDRDAELFSSAMSSLKSLKSNMLLCSLAPEALKSLIS